MMAAPAHRIAIALAMLVALAPSAGKAAEDAAETACHNKQTTVDIMECVGGLAKRWDKRLNVAYQASLKASDTPARRAALVKAQRAWVAYRDANCDWYEAQEGTIRMIAGADCMLTMTKARATELEGTSEN